MCCRTNLPPDHPTFPRNNRQQVEGLLDENPKFKAMDKAIAKEGFKVILLLRLSPIFPFALSNYLYGVTSVDFLEYMVATLIGFFPGTLAYVYGGTVRVRPLLAGIFPSRVAPFLPFRNRKVASDAASFSRTPSSLFSTSSCVFVSGRTRD